MESSKKNGNGNLVGNTTKITEKVILLRINKSYKESMGESKLYEASHGNWRTGERRNGAEFAFAVYKDIVKEVYVIESWSPAKNKSSEKRPIEDLTGKWEFQGSLASESIREKYIDKDVNEYFKGSANSLTYVNC